MTIMYTYMVILNLFEFEYIHSQNITSFVTELIKWDTFDTMVKKMSYLWQMYPLRTLYNAEIWNHCQLPSTRTNPIRQHHSEHHNLPCVCVCMTIL